jgi:hypothetical protein
LDNNKQNNPKSLNPFASFIAEGVSIFTAVKNRREMLEKTLPTWLVAKEVKEIIIVDWSSDDDPDGFISSLNSTKILLAKVPDQPKWSQTLAFNLAARLTTCNILLKMDADVSLFPDFFNNHPIKPGIFYTGDWRTARNENEKHLNGICYLHRNEFFQVNGYNERLKTYAWDDIDLYNRLEKNGLQHAYFNPDLLYHIEHGNRTAFHDYMRFLKTENDMERALLNSLINRFIVELTSGWTSGNIMLPFSVDAISPNFLVCSQSEEDPNPLDPELMQKAEAKAIIERFYELGVKIPREKLGRLDHDALVSLINLYYQRHTSIENQGLFNAMLNLSAELPKPAVSSDKAREETERLTGQLKSEKSKNAMLEKQVDQLDEEICRLNDQLNDIHASVSWKLGHGIVSGAASIMALGNSANSNPTAILRSEQQKVNLGEEIGAYYGQHRSGWGFAISSLAPLHNPAGIILDSFIERTFQWHPKGIHPHKKPWIGFIHVPPAVPEWFAFENSNQTIFNSPAWQESLPNCKGLFTLSAYHRKNLEGKFSFPINNLFHPTGEPLIKWNPEKFLANKDKQVVQVGFWLRKLFAIYILKAPSHFGKVFIRKENVNLDHLLEMEKKHSPYQGRINADTLASVQTISYLSDAGYDRLLSENIVFLDLYDASANNSVIECIVRNTPVLVNPIEPVVEYLGEKYPFFYHDLPEAAEKLNDFALIRETHRYLLKHSMKKRLTASYFRSSVLNSPLYKSI